MPTDPNLTLSNMTSALNNLPDTMWYRFGEHVNVPLSKRNEIHSQFHRDGERKREVFRIYLTEHPQPTWEHVSNVLYQLGHLSEQYHSALDTVQSMFPTGECLHVSPSFLLYHLPPPVPLSTFIPSNIFCTMYVYIKGWYCRQAFKVVRHYPYVCTFQSRSGISLCVYTLECCGIRFV